MKQSPTGHASCHFYPFLKQPLFTNEGGTKAIHIVLIKRLRDKDACLKGTESHVRRSICRSNGFFILNSVAMPNKLSW